MPERRCYQIFVNSRITAKHSWESFSLEKKRNKYCSCYAVTHEFARGNKAYNLC